MNKKNSEKDCGAGDHIHKKSPKTSLLRKNDMRNNKLKLAAISEYERESEDSAPSDSSSSDSDIFEA